MILVAITNWNTLRGKFYWQDVKTCYLSSSFKGVVKQMHKSRKQASGYQRGEEIGEGHIRDI